MPELVRRPELLVLRALKLGDLLVAVPALKALRREFPGHRIRYAAQEWLRPVLPLTGAVDDLLPLHGLDVPIPLEPGQIDIAVNLHGSGPESCSRLEAVQPARRIGHAGPGWDGPPWKDGVHERDRWADLLSWHGIPADPLDYRLDPPPAAAGVPEAVVIHVGAAYGSRLWPADRFADVARELSAAGAPVLFTGSAGERRRALAVASAAGLPTESVVAGKLRLEEFAAVIARSRLVLSADTGAAHLASAYARPSVVLFGPAPVSEWGPPPGPHIALTDESRRRGDTFAGDPDPALLAVTVEDVLSAVEKLEAL
ncbi:MULTISPECIES: glycosyltransferase family 9 protein [unclassified Arthrobacter]|uniref:glycosyltransferase family 9 protein n=1 Tax=unclassified Arthrobacter TaxID=235627 RepID=UPI001E308A79|nr:MULTISPECIES: glycosyltransferase family 9 protein [unclassified Arthrobacter]MCC9144364.1 glycosyltransferase family 9 protein [Arthrobacter sp. zg-Y919]MDK1275590.1 glycosyltransferase family 9 protein [Arthrobacter sp. zg.Y919]MDM7991222.1 glycosyltransferase family 9 protein [Arthrobacter sp. zg-Y877]WIB03041.1 glycosyltransferase family 9 protein [Arthrobacter sp. zg-Y919]